jgi:uncharacterized SAM-binding protein YcdF (DUF218 family)
MNSSDGTTFWRPALCHAAIGVAGVSSVVLVLWLAYGRDVVEKLLTALALPCGLIWLAICFALYLSVRLGRKGFSVLLAAVLIAYTLGGNPLFGGWLVGTLENRFRSIDPLTGAPFDLLVVLGGDVCNDRSMLAARLYHRGKANRVVTTGSPIEAPGPALPKAAEQTAEVLQDVSVPPSAITMIDGRNTAEEMRNLARLVRDAPPARVGLVTSAWHLPRAMRLAKGAGLAVYPVPARFESEELSPLPICLVPSPEGFRMTHIALKEGLAYLVDR